MEEAGVEPAVFAPRGACFTDRCRRRLNYSSKELGASGEIRTHKRTGLSRPGMPVPCTDANWLSAWDSSPLASLIWARSGYKPLPRTRRSGQISIGRSLSLVRPAREVTLRWSTRYPSPTEHFGAPGRTRTDIHRGRSPVPTRSPVRNREPDPFSHRRSGSRCRSRTGVYSFGNCRPVH